MFSMALLAVPAVHAEYSDIPSRIDDVACLIIRLIEILTVATAALLIMLAGVKYMTSKDAASRSSAKTAIISVFVGLTIIFTSIHVINYLLSGLGREIDCLKVPGEDYLLVTQSIENDETSDSASDEGVAFQEKPDLVITSFSFELDPRTPDATPADYLARINIKNVGSKESAEFMTFVVWGDEDICMTFSFGLEAGEEKELECAITSERWQSFLEGIPMRREKDLTIIVDPDNMVDESRKDNNKKTIGMQSSSEGSLGVETGDSEPGDCGEYCNGQKCELNQKCKPNLWGLLGESCQNDDDCPESVNLVVYNEDRSDSTADDGEISVSAGETVYLEIRPLDDSGSEPPCTGSVSWGDGKGRSQITASEYDRGKRLYSLSHSYGAPGDYKLEITCIHMSNDMIYEVLESDSIDLNVNVKHNPRPIEAKTVLYNEDRTDSSAADGEIYVHTKDTVYLEIKPEAGVQYPSAGTVSWGDGSRRSTIAPDDFDDLKNIYVLSHSYDSYGTYKVLVVCSDPCTIGYSELKVNVNRVRAVLYNSEGTDSTKDDLKVHTLRNEEIVLEVESLVEDSEVPCTGNVRWGDGSMPQVMDADDFDERKKQYRLVHSYSDYGKYSVNIACTYIPDWGGHIPNVFEFEVYVNPPA